MPFIHSVFLAFRGEKFIYLFTVNVIRILPIFATLNFLHQILPSIASILLVEGKMIFILKYNLITIQFLGIVKNRENCSIFLLISISRNLDVIYYN